MLVFLITEAIDILYSLGKISYNSIAWLYYWYTNTSPEKQKELQMKTLEERISELERLIEGIDGEQDD